MLLCLLLLCMLFLICMVLNICNFIQRTEQVPIELDISAIEDYIILLLYTYRLDTHKFFLFNFFSICVAIQILKD